MNLKTPTSILQELMVQYKVAPPQYKFEASGEDHCKTFDCKVTANGQIATGTGQTKQDAKHDAAKNCLSAIGININNSEVPKICVLPLKNQTSPGPFINYVGQLNEFASINRCAQPLYQDSLLVQNGQFVIICIFNKLKTQGSGSNKKDAKQDAAKNMIEEIGKAKNLGLGGSDNANFKSEQIEWNDSVAKYAMDRYEVLMRELHIANQREESSLAQVDNDNYTWDELIHLLNSKGLLYQLSTIQTNPTILCLKINESNVLAIGNSVEEIKVKLTSKVSKMLRAGMAFCSFEE